MKDSSIGKKELIAIGVGTGVAIAGGVLLFKSFADSKFQDVEETLYGSPSDMDVSLDISSDEELPKLAYHKK